MKGKKNVICENCGASFPADEERCPHCGAMHYAGAEKKYMNELEDIREDMASLKTKARETQTKSVKSGLLIGACAVTAILLVATLSSFKGKPRQDLSDRMYEKDTAERLEWQDTYFPLMDEAFRAGDYEKVADIYKSGAEEDGASVYFSWYHNEFMRIYDLYLAAQKAEKEMDTVLEYKSYYVLSQVAELVLYYTEERLTGKSYQPVLNGYSNEELDKIAEFRDYALTVLTKVYGLTNEDILELNSLAMQDSYFDSSASRDWFSAYFGG